MSHVVQVVPYEVYTGALKLDGPTLHNLELLEGGEGGPDGSLLAQLDTCSSPGGCTHLLLAGKTPDPG